MKTHLRFFSRLRDLTGKSEMELDVPEGAKVADLLETLYAQTPALNFDLPEGTKVSDLLETLYERTPALRDWDKSILVASGVEFVTRDHALTPGDDISIMPPVQGG